MNTKSDSARNPFPPSDQNRREIWDMLMRRDFEAFVSGNWAIVEADFWREGFCGIDAQKEPNPDLWKITFPDVDTYRDEWLRQVREFAPVQLEGILTLDFLYDSCRLEAIEITGQRALAHKKFDGSAKTVDGKSIVLRFQSLYQLILKDQRWKIAGFVGYLPNPMHGISQSSASTPW